MPKKNATPPETRITVTLDSDALLGSARIMVSRENNVVIGEFEYRTLADLATAIGGHLAQVDFDMPAVTDFKDYDPDLETKREQLTVGTWVKTPDGIGCITTTKEDTPEDEVWVDIDGFEEPATYPLIALVATTPPDENTPVPTLAQGDLTEAASTTVQSKQRGDNNTAQLTLF